MEWPTVELDSVAEIRGGATPRRDNPTYWNGDIPWVTPTDLPALGEGIVDVGGIPQMPSPKMALLPVRPAFFPPERFYFRLGQASAKLG